MTLFEVAGAVVLGIIGLVLFASLQMVFFELASEIRSTCEVPSDLVGVERRLYINNFKTNRKVRILWSSIGSAVVGFMDLISLTLLVVMFFFN